jgi:hypothetical protein
LFRNKKKITIFLSIVGIAILLFIISLCTSGSNNAGDNYYHEDTNYYALKKVFFAPSLSDFDRLDRIKVSKVFGVLIESEKQFGEKILFATYINGYAGYYRNSGGGCLAGKWHPKNDQNVQHDVQRTFGRNENATELLSKEFREKSAAFTSLANDYLSKALPENGWHNRNRMVTFWFLTEEGPFQCQVPQGALYISEFKDLACAANDIISDLRNSEECLREDSIPPYEELKL